MARSGQISLFRKGTTLLCIAMFLFSYVNSTLFWHGHNVQGIRFYHSHVSGPSHRTGNTDGGHTAAQLILIQTVNQASFTEDAVQSIDLRPFRPAEGVVTTPAFSQESVSSVPCLSLRGPPVLV